MTTSTAILICNALSKRYGRRVALEAVDMSLPRGRCLALLGQNGAGKTTLVKLILGLTSPSSGTVRVLGQDPRSINFHHSIGFLPENVAFDETMTIYQILRFYASLRSVPQNRCDEVLAAVNLTLEAGQVVRTCSKGMRQRLGLAIALLGHPQLFLFDEPTSGLDPYHKQIFFTAVTDLIRSGSTVVLSSHGLAEIEAHADQVVILHQGRLIVQGNLDELYRQAGLQLRLLGTTSNPLAVAEHLNVASGLRLAEGAIELVCPLEEKMIWLRRLVALGDLVEDINLCPPTLSDLYRYFTGSMECKK